MYAPGSTQVCGRCWPKVRVHVAARHARDWALGGHTPWVEPPWEAPPLAQTDHTLTRVENTHTHTHTHKKKPSTDKDTALGGRG